MDKHVTITELAQRSGRSRAFLTNLIRQGRLPQPGEGWRDGRTRILPLNQCLAILDTIPQRTVKRQSRELWDECL